MDVQGIATIVALIVSLGGAFFTWGVTMQQVKELKQTTDAHGVRLGAMDKDLREGAVSRAELGGKIDGISSQLGLVLDRIDQLVEKKDH